jgi:hypothetical protein
MILFLSHQAKPAETLREFDGNGSGKVYRGYGEHLKVRLLYSDIYKMNGVVNDCA